MERNAVLQAALEKIQLEEEARMQELEELTSTVEGASQGSDSEFPFGMNQEMIKSFTGFSLQV